MERVALPVAALVWLLVAAYLAWRKARPALPVHASDPPERFYHPYTTEFDRVRRGAELVDALVVQGTTIGPGSREVLSDPQTRQELFEGGYAQAGAGAPAVTDLSGTAIAILVDQSGSMAPVLPRVAGELLAVCEQLEAAGAAIMLAGFTTVGWHGGLSRKLWVGEGRPAYPGRLCDLLHIIYSDFGEASTAELLAPMLAPAICFENVDGEAILWAEQSLLAQSHPSRCLIVVSDGAPVDDSTLSANGPSFLWNHLEDTVSAIGARGQIALGGVGIDHDVSRLYPAARQVSADGGLSAAIIAVAAELRG